MTQEMGKVLGEARGDVQEAIDMTFYMAGEGRRLFGPDDAVRAAEQVRHDGARSRVGVVGAITPWNFPMAIPSWKIMPALVAGNTVVFKPATDTPLLGDRASSRCWRRRAAGGRRQRRPRRRRRGRRRDRRASRRRAHLLHRLDRDRRQVLDIDGGRTLKRVSLEMGGKNAIIVMDDADLDLATDGMLWSAFGTTGQRCTAASRVIVHRARLRRACQTDSSARTRSCGSATGWRTTTDVGPLVKRRASSSDQLATSQIGQQRGRAARTGGEIATDGGLGTGYFHQPTIFDDVEADMRIAQEEIFGPVTAIIPVDSLDEAIQVANGVKYGLSSSIYTRDVNGAFRAMRDIDTGIVYVNAGTIGAEMHLPFGGTKAPATATARRARRRWTCSPNGSRSTSTTRGKLQRAQIDVTE